MREPEQLFFQMLCALEDVDQLATRLTDSRDNLFNVPSVGLPRFVPPELGFLKTVSWLYVFYFELAAVSTKFLLARFEVYEIGSEPLLNHTLLVRNLRTQLQHNLDPNSDHDLSVQVFCEDWYVIACGTAKPSDSAQWRSCLSCLLDDAAQFAACLRDCAREIERDESREVLCREWKFRLDRHISAARFKELVAEVAADMGRGHLDPGRLCQRFYDRWLKALRQLDDDVDPTREARKLIENTLLNEILAVLPVTGKDIIDAFSLSPGPAIGEMLEEARESYQHKPCSREELLERLRPYAQKLADQNA